ncbi:MAG: hypothetical protein OXE87_05320 [Chloroflexi bacterium]|nr:hypothetical protein [Chloroflexota bacterium]
MPSRITRDDEGINLRFADYDHYETSGDFAYDFIVDYTPEDRAIGLEILWNAQERNGLAEGPVLAFGIFGSALAEMGWRYNSDVVDAGRKAVAALHHRIKTMIDSVGADLRVSSDTPVAVRGGTRIFDLIVSDPVGKPLVCAEVKQGSFQRQAVEQLAYYLKNLADTTAIGVCVFIDETGEAHHNPPVEPGRWIDWPQATLPSGRPIWAHVMIIPPAGCEYPWLPKSFLPSWHEVGTDE